MSLGLVRTCLVARGRFLPLEGEDAGSQQSAIEALQRTCFLRKLLTALIGHHIDMPDLDIGLLLSLNLCFDLLLDASAVPDVGEDECLNTQIRNHLSSPRAIRAIRACDQDRLALEGLGWCGELGVLLLAEHWPWKNLCRDPVKGFIADADEDCDDGKDD